MDFDERLDIPSNPFAIVQKKASEAGVIVFVLSKAFADSDTCKQHVSISRSLL